MRSLNLEYSNAVIHHGILSRKPFMAGRLGLTEATLLWYTGIGGREPSGEIYRRLSWGVGLFPVTKDSIRDFMDKQFKASVRADAMMVWNKHSWEEKLLSTPTVHRPVRLHRKVMSAAFLLDNPWTNALAGKKVLVVHPFSETIVSQYLEVREEIGLLPEFELGVVQAPQTIGPQREGSWAVELEALEQIVDASDFDVALIGCGGYGMPLAGSIRERGRKAIVMGGTLQLLFGIKGKRWDNVGLYNEHWVRPTVLERPPGYKNVEGGCYW